MAMLSALVATAAVCEESIDQPTRCWTEGPRERNVDQGLVLDGRGVLRRAAPGREPLLELPYLERRARLERLGLDAHRGLVVSRVLDGGAYPTR
jgi:hypothetical protein